MHNKQMDRIPLYAIPLALATLSTTAAAKNSSSDPILCNCWTAQPALFPCPAGLHFLGPTLLDAKNTTCFSYRQPNSDITQGFRDQWPNKVKWIYH